MSEANDQHATKLPRRYSRSRLSRGDAGSVEDFGTIVPQGFVATGVRSLADIPHDHILCRDCNGDQAPWLEDYGCVCQTCNGLGHHKDKNYEGGSSDDFDPISSYGTYHEFYVGRRSRR
jgi:hypothetical protein